MKMMKAIKLVILASIIPIVLSSGSVFDDFDLGDVYNNGGGDSQQQQQHQSFDNMIQDWDSGLYGKPVCMRIPANMSLCVNLNYERMKVPNLLGHDTIEEVCFSFSLFTLIFQIKMVVKLKIYRKKLVLIIFFCILTFINH